MPYAAASAFFIVLSLAASASLLYYYVQRSYRSIPWGTHIFLFIAMFVCILPFPMLVLDVDSGLHWDPSTVVVTPEPAGSGAGGGSWAGGTHIPPTPPPAEALKPEWAFMHAIWLVVFFSTQLLAWVILPIAQEYDQSGDFTPMKRFKDSIKCNLKMYIILGVVVGALFGYIVFLKGARTFADILSLALAAANAFGLVLLVVFMSYGLVGLPKQLWRKADPKLLLRIYYYSATDLQEEFDIVKMDLAELKSHLIALDPHVQDEDDKHRLARLLDEIDETVKVVPVHHSAALREFESSERIDEAYLVDLSTQTKKTTRLAKRLNHQWHSLQRGCVELDSVASGNNDEVSKNNRMYYLYIRKPFLRTLAILAVIMTILVAWSELVLPIQSLGHRTLSVAEMLVNNKETSFFGSTIFLFYMASCAYWATFQFKVFNLFCLVPRHTDGASLCFTCTFLTRLLLPLCYNFLWISDLTQGQTHVVYSELFGTMSVIDFLGDTFNQFLPVGIPIFCVLIELKIFDRILSSAGIDRNDPTDLKNEVVLNRIQDGRQLIAQMVGRELTAPTGADALPPTTSPRANSSRSKTPPPVITTGTGTTTMTGKPQPGARYADWKAKRAEEGASKN